MATIEDEKGYEIAKQYLTKKYGDDYVDFLETEGQSYLDGYEQGYEDCRHYAHDYYTKNAGKGSKKNETGDKKSN